jgi:hypothetical protein
MFPLLFFLIEKNTLKKQFVSLHHAYEQSLIRHTQDSNEYSEEIVKCFAKDIATAITFCKFRTQ